MYNQQPPLHSLSCPICNNTQLAFVTKYQKQTKLRTINIFFILISIILFVAGSILSFSSADIIKSHYTNGTYIDGVFFPAKGNTINYSTLIGAVICMVLAIIFLIIFIVIKVNISSKEKNPHICAVCNICGKVWNLD